MPENQKLSRHFSSPQQYNQPAKHQPETHKTNTKAAKNGQNLTAN
jgi:hypothetical protein